MEGHLFKSLDLSTGATVLDTDYKIGYVTIHIVIKGLCVFGIDIINHYLVKVNKNIKAVNLKQQISIQKMDYYSLDGLHNNLINGVYTIKTLIHATDPK